MATFACSGARRSAKTAGEKLPDKLILWWTSFALTCSAARFSAAPWRTRASSISILVALEIFQASRPSLRGNIILVSFGFVLKLAKVGREISLTEVEDLSILREAQKELGIKER